MTLNRAWIRRVVDSRWFALADFAIVFICVILLTIQELDTAQEVDLGNWDIGGWPIVFALIPWGIRLAAGRTLFQRTKLDFPIAIFLLTAAIGIWTAYDREVAWAKFWVIFSGILIYYAIAGQPQINQWILTGIIGLGGFCIAVYYLFSPSWETTGISTLLDDIGIWWMSIRPSLQAPAVHPNAAAGGIALMVPFILASGIHAWSERKIILVLFLSAAGGITLFALFLTGSRGAWVALSSALGIWMIWFLSGVISQRIRLSRIRIFAFSLLALSALILWLVTIYPGGIVGLVDSLPGPPNAGTRLDLTRDTIDLIADFPITGAGLRSFSGLHSQYILTTPLLSVEHAHNIYLETLLETGPLSLMALIALLVGSGWLLMGKLFQSGNSAKNRDVMRWAIFSALIVISVHGLVDYMHEGTPLIMLTNGMAIALAQPGSLKAPGRRQVFGEASTHAQNVSLRRWKIAGTVLVLVATILSFYIFRRPLLANWYANIGALEMARVELEGWLSVEGINEQVATSSVKAETLFYRALQYDPLNRTSHHRLGLIAMLRNDFTTAVDHLERAFQIDEDHRGIGKSLGYSYAGSGKFSGIVALNKELSNYKLGSPDEVFVAWGTSSHAKPFFVYEAQKYSNINYLDKALLFYTFALDIDSQDGQLYFERGVVKLRSGYDPETDFARAAQLSSRVNMYHRIAMAYVDYGAYYQRAEFWCHAIESDFQMPQEATLCLGKYFFYNGQFDQALGQFATVTRLSQDNSGGWAYWLGRTYLRLGRPENAIHYLELAISQTAPPLVWSYHELARAYRANSECSKAIAAFKMTLSLGPRYTYRDEAFRELEEMLTGSCR